ncbi:sugar transferase [Poseidonocella sp. HB161398]|uniref:sugar transferase n=1 Tax=Poseidonocella sp. HB161398 TaxID=2320855 RepID=UPI00148718A9|nr:sugar transferase [Poseidonocella sp. HB161398]
MDIIFSIAALPTFVMLCVIFMILNVFWNAGPLFFFQERAGKDGRPFVMVKFRTMRPAQQARGPNDPLEQSRITPLGKWMRQTRMDEVPQIINVLLGHMSIVGPRPEILEFDRQFRREIPGYEVRGNVRPGITGYAQVKQGYTDSIEMVRTKNTLDRYYVDNMGMRLDLSIMLQTIGVIFSFYGAR